MGKRYKRHQARSQTHTYDPRWQGTLVSQLAKTIDQLITSHPDMLKSEVLAELEAIRLAYQDEVSYQWSIYQESLSRKAQELYLPSLPCPQCRQMLSLAERLKGDCPRCRNLILPSLISPGRAQEILADLEARRRELGLEVRAEI